LELINGISEFAGEWGRLILCEKELSFRGLGESSGSHAAVEEEK